METLKFLVNNSNADMDFKHLRETFRILDVSNSGSINKEQLKKAIKLDDNISYYNQQLINKIIEKMFAKFDFNKDGEINYSEFLAATVCKKQVLTRQNLRFAFHHFDTDNEGYITKNDLKEVFRRSGQTLTDSDLNTIIKQAKEPDEEYSWEEQGDTIGGGSGNAGNGS